MIQQLYEMELSLKCAGDLADKRRAWRLGAEVKFVNCAMQKYFLSGGD